MHSVLPSTRAPRRASTSPPPGARRRASRGSSSDSPSRRSSARTSPPMPLRSATAPSQVIRARQAGSRGGPDPGPARCERHPDGATEQHLEQQVSSALRLVARPVHQPHVDLGLLAPPFAQVVPHQRLPDLRSPPRAAGGAASSPSAAASALCAPTTPRAAPRRSAARVRRWTIVDA